MDARSLEARIRERLDALAIHASDDAVHGCAAYLAILHRWNQRLNLTGFDLASPSRDALDRLIVEPLAAARLVRPSDRIALDIGTGGGSPALPFKLACPWLRAVWFEARARKAAFLREAVRVVGVPDVDVVSARFGESGVSFRQAGSVDVVTIRAVRLDDALAAAIRTAVTRPARIIVFAVKQQKTRLFQNSYEVIDLWKGGPAVEVFQIGVER